MTTLFVATGDGFARIAEKNDAWSVTTALTGEGVQCLTLDPRRPDTLYVGSSGKGLFKSTDGGARWRRLHLPESILFSLAVSPVDGAVYAGCEPSKVFKSDDGGQSWRELSALRAVPSAPKWSFPPRPHTSHVRWIAPSPHDAQVLLAGIEAGALLRSADGGETWEDHRPGALPDVHTLAWHPKVRGRAYEAGGFGGAAWSDDNGKTWRRADAGLNRRYVWALTVDPDDPDLWYISDSPGPGQAHNSGGGAQARILRWRGRNGPWQALAGGLPQPLDRLPYALAAVPGALFAGLGDGGLYASGDKGDTWQKLTLQGEPLTGVRALVCAP